MNDENLVNLEPNTERTRMIASMGGKARGKQKTREKNLRIMASKMLQCKMRGKSAQQITQNFAGLVDEDCTAEAAIIAGQIAAAIRGNTRAMEALAEFQREVEDKERIGEQDGDKQYHYDLDIVGDNFHWVMRDIRNKGHEEYVFHGGRASLKSSFVSNSVLELMRNNPEIHGLVLRKVGNTLRDSVYAQIQWALGMQGMLDDVEIKKSPPEITFKKTGQKIYFRGADKPEKIKSIKPPFGYIGVLWLEELDQFGEEEVRSIRESAIRGGEKAWVFKSFNPPKSADNWANRYIKIPKKNMLVHQSTYLEAPPEWLGRPFIEEAEHLKSVNPDAYEHEYLGVANGAGGNVFTQIELRTITDEEIATFDHIFQGVDWGCAPDPYCFVRLHYDHTRETIYFIAEHTATGHEALNTVTAEYIHENGLDDYPVTCDSAEKKSVLDYRDLGLRSNPARKGAGSVEYGMKWLAGRKLVIDPQRTPFIADEFCHYEFERDKDGNLITGYPDKDNHSIDATRYALEKYCNQRYNPA